MWIVHREMAAIASWSAVSCVPDRSCHNGALTAGPATGPATGPDLIRGAGRWLVLWRPRGCPPFSLGIAPFGSSTIPAGVLPVVLGNATALSEHVRQIYVPGEATNQSSLARRSATEPLARVLFTCKGRGLTPRHILPRRRCSIHDVPVSVWDRLWYGVPPLPS